MYGMIHKAIAEMLDEQAPPGLPDPVAKMKEDRPDLFFSPSMHSDEITLEIMSCAATTLGLPMDEFMIRFGEFWIRFADRGTLGPLMQMAGGSLAEFIASLDRIHVAVREALPSALLPKFRLVEASGTELVFAYVSQREGLEPFVCGLFQGLLLRFGHDGTVSRVQREPDHEIWFRVILDRNKG